MTHLIEVCFSGNEEGREGGRKVERKEGNEMCGRKDEEGR